MDFDFSSFISKTVKVKEEIQKEQEIQEKRAKEKKEREEKEEKERQEKTEFATFLDLTPKKDSSDLEQTGTPSPQKEQDENKIRKRSLRKSWEMTTMPSPIKNRQYLKPQNITPKNLNLNPTKKRSLSPAKKPSLSPSKKPSLSPATKLIFSPKKILIPKKIFVNNTPEVRQRSSRTVKTPLRFTENCESYFNGDNKSDDTDSDSYEQPSAKKIRKTLISSPKKIFIPEKKAEVPERKNLNVPSPDPDFNDGDSNFEPPENTDSDVLSAGDSDVLSLADSDEPFENIRKNNSSPKKKVYERKKLNASADSDFTLDESNFEPPPEIPPPTLGVNERPKVIKLTKRYCGKHQLRWYYSSYKKKLRCKGCSKIFESKLAFDQHLRFFNKDRGSIKKVAKNKENSDFLQKISKTVNSLCNTCNTSFDSITKLVDHVNLEHKKIFKCTVCDVEFPSKSNLDDHISRFHGKSKNIKYKCTICQKSFATEGIVRAHIATTHKSSIYGYSNSAKTSTNVGNTSTTTVKVGTNMVQIRANLGKSNTQMVKTSTNLPKTSTNLPNTSTILPKTSTNMGKTSTSLAKTSTNLAKSSTNLDKTSTSQGKTSTSQGETNTIWVKTKPNAVKTSTNLEDKTNSGDYSLDDITDFLTETTPKSGEETGPQTKSSKVQEETNFQCAICDNIFENRTKLALHIEMKHTKATQKKPKSPLKAELMCPFCQKEFREKSQFTVHISKTRNGQCPTVHEIPQSVGSPKKADKQTNLEDGSDVEEYSIRGGKKFFNCRFCSKDFSTKRNLESHVQLVHDDSDSAEDDDITPFDSPIKSQPKETFKCIKCNSEFTEKLSLTEHYTSVHEKKKPFKCSICRKAFVSKGNVKLHIVAVHKKNKNQADDFIYEDTTSSDTSVDKGDTKSSKSTMKSVKVLPKTAEEPRYSLERESELAVKNLLGISPKKDSAENNLEPEIMSETLFEDKRPILRCSICNFEVKSVPSMENHVSAAHGLKLKLEVIDSNNTEKVPEVAQTTEITETGETLPQINDLGFSINEALNTEMESSKSENIKFKNTFQEVSKTVTDSASIQGNPETPTKVSSENQENLVLEESIVSQLGLDPNIPMIFKCTICDLEFNSLDTLTEHFSSDHAESQITFAGSDVPQSQNETTIPHEQNHEVHEVVTREMIEAQGFQGDYIIFT